VGEYLSEIIKITAGAPTATGTSAVTGAIIDMAGWEGVLWLARLGSPAANNNIRAQQDTDPAGATMADLQGTLVTHATNNMLMLDLQRPQERYVRCVVTRGTTTTIDTMVVIQYRSRNRPAVQPISTLEQFLSPPEGTA
jgi:hypothetical protein